MLAIFLGFEVISKVPTMLHTPLMSGTNSIHGIVIVGAILVLGVADDTFTKAVGFVAMVLATANVVGGWFVTDRMLEMFKRRPEPKREDDAVISDPTSSAFSTSSRSSASSSRCASSPRRSTRGAETGSAASACSSRSRRRSLLDGIANWALIVVAGARSARVVGVVGARKVKMTAMPQMVALFNGVGGGAAALVALAEFHKRAASAPGDEARLDRRSRR